MKRIKRERWIRLQRKKMHVTNQNRGDNCFRSHNSFSVQLSIVARRQTSCPNANFKTNGYLTIRHATKEADGNGGVALVMTGLDKCKK